MQLDDPPTLAESSTAGEETRGEHALAMQFAWLSRRAMQTLPEPLKRDLESRAIDRFFGNWTLYPRNDGFSASGGGYLTDLHNCYQTLYGKELPNGSESLSVLWLAVRAVAYADMARSTSSGWAPPDTFALKARRYYGAALARLRVMVTDPEFLRRDCTLAALLLIDNFEFVYLGRGDPIGPHSEALQHVLLARGDEQFFDKRHFRLWQVGAHRLIRKLMLTGQIPDNGILEWMGKLNTNLPDNRIWTDTLQMIALNAEIKAFIRSAAAAHGMTENLETLESQQRLAAAQSLMHRTESLLEDTDTAVTQLAAEWKPLESSPENIGPPPDEVEGGMQRSPIPDFPCPIYLRYADIWVAHVWNLHTAAQIFLRETLVDLLHHIVLLRAHIPASSLSEDDMVSSAADESRIESQAAAIERLSTAIVESYPPLLGWKYRSQGIVPWAPPQGKMAGRLFSLSSMWIVKMARMTPEAHKRIAGEVIEWINSHHVLADSANTTPIGRGFDPMVEARA
jgi:hypothetical protein